MTIEHCDLALASGLNDGTSWVDARQGNAGLVTSAAALAAGDTVYVKNTSTTTANVIVTGPTTLASHTNPLRIIGVLAATTNEGGSIVQSDLIPGHRTGDATRAYAQTVGNAPPLMDISAGGADITFRGCLWIYGITCKGPDDINIGDATVDGTLFLEECGFEVTGTADNIQFGVSTTANSNVVTAVKCQFEAGPGRFRFIAGARVRIFDSTFNATTTTGCFLGSAFDGNAQLMGCDLSGCDPTLVSVASIRGGAIELWNCLFPASHVLTTGTASESYFVANYGSENSAGLTSADSEQALQIHTLQGTVDVETTAVRTGGADDEATGTGGPFSWALTPNNVTDNFAVVISPWMSKWVLGDGTAKTLTVFIANSSPSTDLQDDEAYLEVMYPDEAGGSIYNYLPDDGAPGDGGGRMQLLGTAADLTDDTGSAWGTGANNHQKLTQSIAPDYRGLVRARVQYSKSSGPTLYIDPAVTVA